MRFLALLREFTTVDRGHFLTYRWMLRREVIETDGKDQRCFPFSQRPLYPRRSFAQSVGVFFGALSCDVISCDASDSGSCHEKHLSRRPS